MFGRHEGEEIADLVKSHRGYVKWLAKYCSNKDVQKEAKSYLTSEEVEKCESQAHICRSKINETNWLKHFLQQQISKRDNWQFHAKVCQTILGNIRCEHRLDKITRKQICIAADLWGNEFGPKGSEEYRDAVLVFRKKMVRHWNKNHSSSLPVNEHGEIHK